MSVNPALSDLRVLVGDWRMELFGASFLPDPDTRIPGSFRVDWIEDGAVLAMHQGDGDQPPAATWIVGRDDSAPDYRVFYRDDRGVSRIYGMSLIDGLWRMWRSTDEFSQRFSAQVLQDGQRISGTWEKSVDGGATWEHDFDLDYTRLSGAGTDRQAISR